MESRVKYRCILKYISLKAQLYLKYVLIHICNILSKCQKHDTKNRK